jgi:hypothetical protein
MIIPPMMLMKTTSERRRQKASPRSSDTPSAMLPDRRPEFDRARRGNQAAIGVEIHAVERAFCGLSSNLTASAARPQLPAG